MSPLLAPIADPTVALDEPQLDAVAETVRDRARDYPDAVAVVDCRRCWTNAELLRCSEALAPNFAPAQVVALTGDPSFGLVAAALAVLGSGAILLPIDAALPAERRRRMLRAANATLAVIVSDADAEADRLDSLPVVRVDPSGEPWREPAPAGPAHICRGDDPAYIFFTSGTTGHPKGILGRHKSLAHFLRWQREQFQVGPADRVAQLTNLSFDVVLRDIFLPLTSGAAVAIPHPRERADVPAWLRDRRITILHVTPTVADNWIAGVPSALRLPALRWIFFSGEPLADATVRRWRAAAPQAGIVNLYGPTETTMVKCFHVVPDPPKAGVQAIGRPLPNTQALVLTPDGKLCGPGEPGEIVIRTPFRTLGYLSPEDDPEKRFRPNPFRDDPDDVLYWTGDRGRYRGDGVLEFIARLDDQVKIMGVRIEPAEVATVLLGHPLVRSCFVAGSVFRGESRLAAYIVPQPGKLPGADDLRAFAAALLPAAAVPSAFVLLATLPLLPNGKVDRRCLPAPRFEAPAETAAPPRDGLEQQVAAIWRHVLRRTDIGIDENFFLIGGDSLKGLRVVSEVANAMGVAYSARLLFDHPTIAEMSAAVADALNQTSLQG